jgi:hypothetical protein
MHKRSANRSVAEERGNFWLELLSDLVERSHKVAAVTRRLFAEALGTRSQRIESPRRDLVRVKLHVLV